MESISEAFNKCFVADFIFSISRTPEDKKLDTGRIFIAKNRNGVDGIIFPIKMSTRKRLYRSFGFYWRKHRGSSAGCQEETREEIS